MLNQKYMFPTLVPFSFLVKYIAGSWAIIIITIIGLSTLKHSIMMYSWQMAENPKVNN